MPSRKLTIYAFDLGMHALIATCKDTEFNPTTDAIDANP